MFEGFPETAPDGAVEFVDAGQGLDRAQGVLADGVAVEILVPDEVFDLAEFGQVPGQEPASRGLAQGMSGLQGAVA